ncbi:transcriptional regulator [Acinetobacter sp. R933-2]|uniref:transcriptional regulator n=1 Tax=Acinetobacter sp. R933-2 TaxID=2746728 RepID=UPI0025771976|nr:transcriptional regulator [Acinetobacter sp. R933-2]MDM1248885.1 transcriptional regulator [Acinetobacter sp. R933-2]
MDVLKLWLIAKRQEMGISQYELALRLAQPVEYVERIEEGVYVLELIKYLQYCQALQADPYEGIQLIELALINV